MHSLQETKRSYLRKKEEKVNIIDKMCDVANKDELFHETKPERVQNASFVNLTSLTYNGVYSPGK